MAPELDASRKYGRKAVSPDAVVISKQVLFTSLVTVWTDIVVGTVPANESESANVESADVTTVGLARRGTGCGV